MSGELTQYRLVKYVHGMTWPRAAMLLNRNGWTTFAEVDAWIEASPRRIADQCCDVCRARRGNGPWCGRCGRENPDGLREDGTAFTMGECVGCEPFAFPPDVSTWFADFLAVRS